MGLYYYDILGHFREKREREERERERQYGQHYQGEKMTEEERARREEKHHDMFNKIIVLRILTKEDENFMAEDKLLAEVTFRIMEFKNCWHTRMKEGHIVLRVFEDRIDF